MERASQAFESGVERTASDAYSDARGNELLRKRQLRQKRRELLRKIDAMLPQNARRSNPVKTSGSRACGSTPATSHDGSLACDVIGCARRFESVQKLAMHCEVVCRQAGRTLWLCRITYPHPCGATPLCYH